ncbi:NAD(P)/FAD-dependent oxidoreductase [Celeribacter persicus]|uniref:Flavin-dependent dehydrogenase n=1 Tax=Celeribacter persicus TaxID=1651082 RepID=A0A2T5HCL5_9RHOB|nr:FAD-dependent monooxygenase [Celeribacter persicus]PTQ69316.1 flavin-dependent dehydrogenase [Celeribacter persicus]
MSRAVVLGGGYAGLLAAVALRDHVDEVMVIERDRYPDLPEQRLGVPQSRHCHLMVESCMRALEALMPGTIECLLSAGARRIDLTNNALISAPMGWFERFDLGTSVISCSRALVDHVMRENAGIEIRQETTADRLFGDKQRVGGVVLNRGDGTTEKLDAALVVDATGRNSKAPDWLSTLGVPAARASVVSSGMASSSRRYAASNGLYDVLPAILLQPQDSASANGRGATVYPIENEEFIVTLTGPKSDPPPVTEDGFLQYARSVGPEIVADLMAASPPVGLVNGYRNLSNIWRHYDEATFPRGFLALGDAFVAVEPTHSLGMASAALGARWLSENLPSVGLDGNLQAGIAEAATAFWDVTRMQQTAQDKKPEKPSSSLSSLERRISQQIALATLRSKELAKDFFQTRAHPGEGSALTTQERLKLAMKVRKPPLSTLEAMAQFPELEKWVAEFGVFECKIESTS